MKWQSIQDLDDADVELHFAAASAVEDGLIIPLEVFAQLFHDHYADPEFAARLPDVDWTLVAWVPMTMTGAQLRNVGIPRLSQFAVDEARTLAIDQGIQDPRPAVIDH